MPRTALARGSGYRAQGGASPNPVHTEKLISELTETKTQCGSCPTSLVSHGTNQVVWFFDVWQGLPTVAFVGSSHGVVVTMHDLHARSRGF